MTVVPAAVTQVAWTGHKEPMIRRHEELPREAAADGVKIICYQELFDGPCLGVAEDQTHHPHVESIRTCRRSGRSSVSAPAAAVTRCSTPWSAASASTSATTGISRSCRTGCGSSSSLPRAAANHYFVAANYRIRQGSPTAIADQVLHPVGDAVMGTSLITGGTVLGPGTSE